MCDTCGCKSTGGIGLTANDTANEIRVVQDVLGSNDRQAEENRHWLRENRIFTMNLVGSPGSGKTTLIVKTIEALSKETPVYVIEGDQYGSLDSDRISATGTPVVQINTGNGCHLDANNIRHAITRLNPVSGSLLIIENVGNLVCPAMFDLGEHRRVVLLSVTEGDDKPLKYAPIFYGSSTCVINKTDLLPHVEFDIEKARQNLKKINHHAEIFTLSAAKEDGLSGWINMIRQAMKSLQAQKRNADTT